MLSTPILEKNRLDNYVNYWHLEEYLKPKIVALPQSVCYQTNEFQKMNSSKKQDLKLENNHYLQVVTVLRLQPKLTYNLHKKKTNSKTSLNKFLETPPPSFNKECSQIMEDSSIIKIVFLDKFGANSNWIKPPDNALLR